MALMISLDDVMKVLEKTSLIDEIIDIELLKSEFEQKCYIQNARYGMYQVKDIVNRINPETICENICSDRLSDWCEYMRANLGGYYELLLRMLNERGTSLEHGDE